MIIINWQAGTKQFRLVFPDKTQEPFHERLGTDAVGDACWVPIPDLSSGDDEQLAVERNYRIHLQQALFLEPTKVGNHVVYDLGKVV